jgi:hypothetical protein
MTESSGSQKKKLPANEAKSGLTNARPEVKALPAATPRKRVPDARNLTTIGASVRDAIAACVGRALTAFALAEIAVLQADADFREEAPMFDNDSDRAPDKPWQTFDNLVSDEPEKGVTAPITVATDVKMGITSLLIAIADLVNESGKLPAVGPLASLAGTSWRESNIVRLMMAVTAQAKPLLREDPMSRDLDFPLVFRQKFEAIVSSKALVDPGSDTVARLFLNFVKVVAWHAAVLAYEGEHLTLNRVTFYSIIASMQASVSADDAPVVRDVLSYIRGQVEAWEAAIARVKAAKKKALPAGRPKATANIRQANASPKSAVSPQTDESQADEHQVEKEERGSTEPETGTLSTPEFNLVTEEDTPEASASAEALDPAPPKKAAAPPKKAATPPKKAATPPLKAATPPLKAAPIAPELNYDTFLDEIENAGL